jgi:hypothetical protein
VPTNYGTTFAVLPVVQKKGDKMKHFIQKAIATAAVISTLTTIAFAQNAPKETLTATLSRTSSSGKTANVRLSKNKFRTETYQANYTVSVPYQDTETYNVAVPYQVQVPYTDYETDYRQEQQCHDVTKYRNENRCEDVTNYRDEYRCEDRTKYREECHDEQKCYIIPGSGGDGEQCRDVQECGTNAQGQQICKTRKVCETAAAGEPQQRCENKRSCENVPYNDRQCSNVRVSYTDRQCRDISVPYSDRQCEIVNVPHQREVTKYRTETRTRTEQRTRTVTKNKTETRCCETKTREVFDQQLQFQVQISFPQNALLSANETESFEITLASFQPGSVAVVLKNTIYSYEILSQSAAGEIITVNMGLKPKYGLSNAGESSIKSLKISYSAQLQKFVVVVDDSISDAVFANRLQTTSSIEIRDLTTDQLIETQPVGILVNGKKGIAVLTNLPMDSKLKAILKVTRSGLLVQNGQIQFSKVITYEKKSVQSENITDLKNEALVKILSQNTNGTNASVSFVDSSDDFSDVATTYKLTLFEILSNDVKKDVGSATRSKEQIIANGNQLLLADILGSKAASILTSGKTFKLYAEINRISTSALLNQPIQFLNKTTVKIK